MATTENTDRRATMDEIEIELSSFAKIGPTNGAFLVKPGFNSEEAVYFTRCVTSYIRESMERGVDGGVPASEAWINALLLEMIDAVAYVSEKQQKRLRAA